MKDYIKTDVKIVEKRLPKYKNQFSSLQISTLKKAINEEKAKQSENFITKK